MSKLSSFIIETAVVGDEKTPGKHFTVRGLNLNDLTQAMITHAPSMVQIYQNFINRREGTASPLFTSDMVKEMLMDALKEAPELVFSLIAYASDDPDGVEHAARMPLVIQLEALEQIVVLSIKSEAELKKLQEIVLRIVEAMTGLAVRLNLPAGNLSDLGFGKSASA